MLPDQHKRNEMIPGVGPMKQVKSNMSYSIFHGSRTIKHADTWNNYKQTTQKGKEESHDGIVVFCTAADQVAILNWHQGVIEPDIKSIANLRPMCFDFAPFLHKPLHDP